MLREVFSTRDLIPDQYYWVIDRNGDKKVCLCELIDDLTNKALSGNLVTDGFLNRCRVLGPVEAPYLASECDCSSDPTVSPMPYEPTSEMITVALNIDPGLNPSTVRTIYRAMWAINRRKRKCEI